MDTVLAQRLDAGFGRVTGTPVPEESVPPGGRKAPILVSSDPASHPLFGGPFVGLGTLDLTCFGPQATSQGQCHSCGDRAGTGC